MAEEGKRVDVRLGAFHCTIEGYDDPAAQLQDIFALVQKLVVETPALIEMRHVDHGAVQEALDVDQAEGVTRTNLEPDGDHAARAAGEVDDAEIVDEREEIAVPHDQAAARKRAAEAAHPPRNLYGMGRFAAGAAALNRRGRTAESDPDKRDIVSFRENAGTDDGAERAEDTTAAEPAADARAEDHPPVWPTEDEPPTSDISSNEESAFVGDFASIEPSAIDDDPTPPDEDPFHHDEAAGNLAAEEDTDAFEDMPEFAGDPHGGAVAGWGSSDPHHDDPEEADVRSFVSAAAGEPERHGVPEDASEGWAPDPWDSEESADEPEKGSGAPETEAVEADPWSADADDPKSTVGEPSAVANEPPLFPTSAKADEEEPVSETEDDLINIFAAGGPRTPGSPSADAPQEKVGLQEAAAPSMAAAPHIDADTFPSTTGGSSAEANESPNAPLGTAFGDTDTVAERDDRMNDASEPDETAEPPLRLGTEATPSVGGAVNTPPESPSTAAHGDDAVVRVSAPGDDVPEEATAEYEREDSRAGTFRRIFSPRRDAPAGTSARTDISLSSASDDTVVNIFADEPTGADAMTDRGAAEVDDPQPLRLGDVGNNDPEPEPLRLRPAARQDADADAHAEPTFGTTDETGYSAHEYVSRSGASSPQDAMAAVAAYLTFSESRDGFTRREIIDVYDRLPGNFPRSPEAQVKGFGKLLHSGDILQNYDGTFRLSDEARDRFQTLMV